MNIAAYCRVSTDKEDQLNSLETQKKFFEEFANKNGHNLVRIYADEGISGTKTKNRTEFLQLMKDARQKNFDMIIVKDISRFARNTVDLLQNIRVLKSLGIETTFLTANMTVLGQSEFILTVFAALAQEESANISKRVKFGKKENAKKGKVPNIVYGYNKTPKNYFQLTINEHEAEIVREIYHMYLTKGYGAAKIANILNERGELTKRKCKFSQNAICRILTNPIYTGKIINGKQEVADFLTGQRAEKEEQDWLVVDRPELAIISCEEQAQAQKLLKSRHSRFHLTSTRESNRYLFSTLIKCKDCGWSFRRIVRTYKNTYVRWVCSGHNGKGADNCPNAIVLDEDDLIQEIDSYLQRMLKDKKQIEKKIREAFLQKYQSDSSNEKEKRELQRELQKYQTMQQKFTDMYMDDLISREMLNREIGGLKEKIEKIESKLRFINRNLDKSENLEQLIAKNFKEIKTYRSIRNMTNLQLKTIIDRIEVDHEGNIDIYFKLLSDLGLDETVLFYDDRT